LGGRIFSIKEGVMIPAIALMVGAYIITRMVIVITDKEETGIVSTILAGITIMVSLYCIYVIISSGVEISNLLRY